MSGTPITSWSDLAPHLSEVGGPWVTCHAWAAGGGDPDGCEIRLVGSRTVYTSAQCVWGKRERVRLSCVRDVDLKVVSKLVTPDAEIEIRRVA